MNFQLYRSQFEIMMATGSSYVSVNGGIVTVNNGSSTCPAGSGRRVLVTPLVAGCQQSLQSNRVPPSTGRVLSTRAQTSSSQPQLPSTQLPSPNVLQKVLLKAHGLNKKEKTFSLRNLDLSVIKSCADLKTEIRSRLTSDITDKQYDVGYVRGTNVVRVRTAEDLDELWALLRKPQNNVAIWCDGLTEETTITTAAATPSRKRSKSAEAPEMASKKRVDTQERVQTLVNQLKDKHSTRYTPMQYRIWGELIVGGQHVSMDEAPDNSMFNRASGGTKNKPKDIQLPVAQALTEAATALTSVLSPKLPTGHIQKSSPAKLIENRSGLYKQLSELQALKSDGIFTEEEYASEKAAIMEILRKLNSRSL